MEEIFITKIHINEVRHLKDLDIPLSETERKHLILTGKNGSGKTSVLEALMFCLDRMLENGTRNDSGLFCSATFSNSLHYIASNLENEGFVYSFIPATRSFYFPKINGPQALPEGRIRRGEQAIHKFPVTIANLYIDRLFAKDEGRLDEYQKIENWLVAFERGVEELLGLKEGELQYDRPSYQYVIEPAGKPIITFNELSAGYLSSLISTLEIIARMQPQKRKAFDIQGIVLIDEIETHLHIDLQKKILPFLTKFFPRIQFIVTTHSPFVINSIDNAVVYDLEKNIRLEGDLSKYSYEAIVEAFYGSDMYSEGVKAKVSEYENLVRKTSLTDEEDEHLEELEAYFEGMPLVFAPELEMRLRQIRESIKKGA